MTIPYCFYLGYEVYSSFSKQKDWPIIIALLAIISIHLTVLFLSSANAEYFTEAEEAERKEETIKGGESIDFKKMRNGTGGKCKKMIDVEEEEEEEEPAS